MYQRRFTCDDQIVFAALSGDNNPLHMDRVAARRYIFGQPVVHGIHSVLWALDSWLKDHRAPVNLRSIKASFHKPIVLEQAVEYSLTSEEAHHVGLELRSGGSVSTRIRLEWDMLKRQRFGDLTRRLPEQRSPRVLTAKEIQTASGALELHLSLEAAATGVVPPAVEFG